MSYRFLQLGACLIAFLANIAHAKPALNSAPQYKIVGSIPVSIPVTPPDISRIDGLRNYSIEELSGYHTISLLNVVLSEEMKQSILNSQVDIHEKDYANGIIPFHQSPGAVDLGMNNVPVLDQGQYGTCVTFSSTAALDAIIGKGDYIDQQCSLELDMADPADDPFSQMHPGQSDPLKGNYWDGAYYATQVTNPLIKQGVIPKGMCFGAYYPQPTASLSLNQYTRMSDKEAVRQINTIYYPHALFSLNTIKKVLNSGHRMAFSSLIGPKVVGYNIKINGQNKTGGLWACQQPSQDKNNNCNGRYVGGHEIVVIGYDDEQQLLKIRNSWNSNVGDNGDYYMTYAYFNYWSSGIGRYGDGTELY